jgi:DNA polymerase-3 subunit beta
LQITVKRVALIEALEKVKPAVPNKATLDVITNYLVKAKDKKIIIIGTDLSFALISDCAGKILKDGQFLLPGRTIAMLKSLTTPEVSFEELVKVEKYVDRQTHWNAETQQLDTTETPMTRRHYSVNIQSGTSTLSFATKDPKEYPPVPDLPDKYPLRFTNLPDSIGEVIYAAATDEARIALNGVYIHKGSKTMEAAGTDGFRMAIAPVRMIGKMEKGIIIPREVALLLQKYQGTINVAVVERDKMAPQAFFSQKGLILVANLRTETYPDYEKIIPKTGSLITCPADPLRAALKQIKAFAPSDGHTILQTKGSSLLVQAVSDADKIEIKIPARGKCKVTYDWRYLQQLVDHMDGTFKVKTSIDKPGFAKIGNTTHILMPIFMK